MNSALQLIGVPVIGLEPEFQPVISHLLPQIVTHRHDIHDMHLQVHDIVCHLNVFKQYIYICIYFL